VWVELVESAMEAKAEGVKTATALIEAKRAAAISAAQAKADKKKAAEAQISKGTLTSMLVKLKLDQYEDALRGLGVAEVADLQDLEEADAEELGMKTIEIKRLVEGAKPRERAPRGSGSETAHGEGSGLPEELAGLSPEERKKAIKERVQARRNKKRGGKEL
jgi:hypothetical protein